MKDFKYRASRIYSIDLDQLLSATGWTLDEALNILRVNDNERRVLELKLLKQSHGSQSEAGE